jgi:uncharacterized membrane protein YcaP (DUF421 family)
MQVIKIIIFSVVSLSAMFFFTKLIGNKQMSQINMFDYINGITIGSIAAELATALDSGPVYPLVAMAVYTAGICLISFISQKSLKLRRFFEGRSLVLMRNGKLYKENFKTAKLDISEFLAQCRINGYFTTDDIEEAFMEPNGRISFNLKSTARPLTPKDIGLDPGKESADITIILDGSILEENLRQSGNNEKWLEKELHRLGIGNVKDIFLAVCDSSNKLIAYKRISESPQNDIFE